MVADKERKRKRVKNNDKVEEQKKTGICAENSEKQKKAAGPDVMSGWNYVATTMKPTAVTHSAVGNFTGGRDCNLIIAKNSHIEIHLFTQGKLQLMLDVPIYARISHLELFRPDGETQDLLIVATLKENLLVFQWDAEATEIIIRESVELPSYTHSIVIDPDCRSIALVTHALFWAMESDTCKVLPFDKIADFPNMDAYSVRIQERCEVWDMQFLYGCEMPTLVILYKDEESESRHVRTQAIDIRERNEIEGPWSQDNVDNEADLLIPVPPPLCGVLINGKEKIMYLGDSAFKAVEIRPSTNRVFGRINADGSTYLLGDDSGCLFLLVISHEDNKVSGLNIQPLGATSIASTISNLGNQFVYVGSRGGSSQLIKLKSQSEAEDSCIEVRERYENLGPIADFCVADFGSRRQCEFVICSGSCNDGSLVIINKKIGVNEEASTALSGIKKLWSLRAATDDPFASFLVVSFVAETVILAMNDEGELIETDIDGFCSASETLSCHDAVCNQFVQVTSSSVRLVSSTSRQLRDEWRVPSASSVNVATANASQVLLATNGSLLVLLEIGDGKLKEVKTTKLEYDISCLNMNPIGKSCNNSQLAAVGTWTDISVCIFSLPDLNLITKKHLGGEIIARSVLLCEFEGIYYLVCALGDGHLQNFRLDLNKGELTDGEKVSLGTQETKLCTFSLKNIPFVFAVSDRGALIYSRNQTLLYGDVHYKSVIHMCAFNSANFPDRLAIALEGSLVIGTIELKQNLHIRYIPLGEQALCICHQGQSGTFAICSCKYDPSSTEGSKMHYIRLLDDQTFEFMSTYSLDQFEYCSSICNCCFCDDTNLQYYCVGTASNMTEEEEYTKGRILVFVVEDRKLRLISEKETEGAVNSLSACSGKLLAVISQKIQIYKQLQLGDGTGQLQFECEYHGKTDGSYVQSRGDIIFVCDQITEVSILTYKHEEGTIIENSRQNAPSNDGHVGAMLFLENDFYLISQCYHLQMIKIHKVFKHYVTYEEGQYISDMYQDDDHFLVGEYPLPEIVKIFRRGSFGIQFPDFEACQVPTTFFGCSSGTFGVIASLPNDLYQLLCRLECRLRRCRRRRCYEHLYDLNKSVKSNNFVDGDLIESFLDMDRRGKEEIAKNLSVSVDLLVKRVEELQLLH